MYDPISNLEGKVRPRKSMYHAPNYLSAVSWDTQCLECAHTLYIQPVLQDQVSPAEEDSSSLSGALGEINPLSSALG